MRKTIYDLSRDIGAFQSIEIPRVMKKLIEAGTDYARRIAPRRSGALIQGIVGAVTPGARGRGGRFISTGTIISRKPENLAGVNNNPRNVPYNIYLEYGRQVNVRNGRTQRYMEATAEWLTDKSSDEVGKSAKKKFR